MTQKPCEFHYYDITLSYIPFYGDILLVTGGTILLTNQW